MEILGIIGFILLIVVLFVGGGLLGWVLKGLGVIFGFLEEGCSTTLGCLVWVVIIIILLLGLAS
jgi:hypothetical protein